MNKKMSLNRLIEIMTEYSQTAPDGLRQRNDLPEGQQCDHESGKSPSLKVTTAETIVILSTVSLAFHMRKTTPSL